jgi:hypothetical protein
MWFMPGHKVTVSLVDGSVISGRTRLAWPGRLRLVEVSTAHGDVPGEVYVYARSVLTVQVTA